MTAVAPAVGATSAVPGLRRGVLPVPAERWPRLHAAIAGQCAPRYAAPGTVGLKINLYRAGEVAGLAQALCEPDLAGCPVESVMVGDSYFMTHLGRPSTRLDGPGEQEWGLRILTRLVAEVREAMDALLPPRRMPFLVGDLPDGAGDSIDRMLAAADRLLAAGADTVKLEAGTPGALACVEAAARRGIPCLVHLGYTPQRGLLARRGDTLEEAGDLFGEARAARDAGACALVLEMVSEAVNAALSAPSPAGVPVYSIFSGRAAHGGQSLNVWDAVFRAGRGQRYFPPTGVLDPDADRAAYRPDLISACLARLLRLTRDGAFPLSPPCRLDARAQAALASLDPWLAA